MKEKIKKYLSKKEVTLILILMIITISSLSYAFFIRTEETESNIARTECFRLTLQGSHDINLQDAYPMSEQEGAALTPYTFTVRNICNTTADYQVNIETLNTSSLDTEYIRVKLDNNASMILKRNELNTTNVNQNVKEGRKIASGTLRSNEEITYNLRLWIDEASTVAQSTNKTYSAKVTISAVKHDLDVAYIVDGVTQSEPPENNGTYLYKNLTCENGTGTWDDQNWLLNVTNITGIAICTVNFISHNDINVTLYGAAGAVIKYTDYNGEQTKTLDSTGKLENVSIALTSEMNSIIFEDTTVAKNPSNLSQNYTKTVNVSSNTENIYVMPDGYIMYWYGYEPRTISTYAYTGSGDTFSGGSTTITRYTNYYYQYTITDSRQGIATNEELVNFSGYNTLNSVARHNSNSNARAFVWITNAIKNNYSYLATCISYYSSASSWTYKTQSIVNVTNSGYVMTISNRYNGNSRWIQVQAVWLS